VPWWATGAFDGGGELRIAREGQETDTPAVLVFFRASTPRSFGFGFDRLGEDAASERRYEVADYKKQDRGDWRGQPRSGRGPGAGRTALTVSEFCSPTRKGAAPEKAGRGGETRPLAWKSQVGDGLIQICSQRSMSCSP
jgi:hypothetical protein